MEQAVRELAATADDSNHERDRRTGENPVPTPRDEPEDQCAEPAAAGAEATNRHVEGASRPRLGLEESEQVRVARSWGVFSQPLGQLFELRKAGPLDGRKRP